MKHWLSEITKTGVEDSEINQKLKIHQVQNYRQGAKINLYPHAKVELYVYLTSNPVACIIKVFHAEDLTVIVNTL